MLLDSVQSCMPTFRRVAHPRRLKLHDPLICPCPCMPSVRDKGHEASCPVEVVISRIPLELD